MGEVKPRRKKAARKTTSHKTLSVVYCSSEVAPFSKTGGLGDVAGALPKALAKLGVEPVCFSPLYACVRERAEADLQDTGVTVRIPIGLNVVEGRILRSRLPGSKVPIFFVEHDGYFNRANLYNDGHNDYADNCERFTFFCRAILEAVESLDLKPDIIHCNDWQTGLIPVYLKKIYRYVSERFRARSVITLHNVSYQGRFWHLDVPLLGLGWDIFNWRELESYGKISFLKGGIVFSDAINTVSPTYAREIQHYDGAEGLGPVLQQRARDLCGILNGIDVDEWDPARDPRIAENYSRGRLRGKKGCKRALQKELGLADSPDVPLVSIVSRFAPQKGMDLVTESFHSLMDAGIQFVVLGSGDPYYHWTFEQLASEYPGRTAVYIGFNEELAHRIYAGSDIFLMPSQTEPCGLTQMYCLRYGVVPVARKTGGLADTVRNYTETGLENGRSNGFTFAEYTGDALCRALRRAVALYKTPAKWRKLVRNGMRRDSSWAASAREYVKFYRRVMKK